LYWYELTHHYPVSLALHVSQNILQIIPNLGVHGHTRNMWDPCEVLAGANSLGYLGQGLTSINVFLHCPVDGALLRCFGSLRIDLFADVPIAPGVESTLKSITLPTEDVISML
jgi:hypothetical protein